MSSSPYRLPAEFTGYLHEMRAVAVDAHGNEHLIGLSVEETRWYIDHIASEGDGHPRDPERVEADMERYHELFDRHELARRQVLMAENERKVQKPSLN